MHASNGHTGRVWQRGPVRLVMVAGFVQLRWRRLLCLSWFTVAGDGEVWLGVPGWTGRLWPIRGQGAGGRRQNEDTVDQGGEHA